MIGPLNDYDDIYSRMSPALKAIYFFSFQKSSGNDIDLSHIHRAIEQSIFFLEGKPCAKLTQSMKDAGPFKGILSGYHHFHIPQSTGSAIAYNTEKNIHKSLKALNDKTKGIEISEEDLKKVISSAGLGFNPPNNNLRENYLNENEASLDRIKRDEKIDKALKSSAFTGDWLIYSIKDGKKRYLTITEHVNLDNDEQQRILKNILDASDKF